MIIVLKNRKQKDMDIIDVYVCKHLSRHICIGNIGSIIENINASEFSAEFARYFSINNGLFDY